jgi:hypothetical protein
MLPAIQYSAKSLATKAAFEALPKASKKGTYWDSDNPAVIAIRSEIKNFYLAQQNYECVYCKQRIVVTHNGAWDAEHIVPKSSHPQFMFIPENLCISCKDCNTEKGDKNVLDRFSRVRFTSDPEHYLIFHPHFDTYSQHIRLLPHSFFYMPKTEKGIKTIETCGLLRFLLKYGEYGVDDTQLKKEIALRHSLLQETTDPSEYMFLIAELEDLMHKLKTLAREAGMKKMLEARQNPQSDSTGARSTP